ncbi:unnamed protein product [Eruca vesicaria subsp. sativa]|uniref:SET domain-containing protein n=1 Tax=Eruca vesicaria subsp. sativa TaxID=29727 RepID=A0ABC8JNP7_ERUVS|nr:unnamed protein product [Eruca vesicaria subsp. sativa]
MEAEKEVEQQENLTAMKLPVLPIKPNSHSHSISSPIHSSIAASVPFSWEEQPGKPKQHSSSSSSSSSPLTSYSSSSPKTHKSLELPPRLHSLENDGRLLTKLNSPITVFDGPYSMTRSRRLDSPSFRMMVKGSGDCYGSFRSDMYGDLDDVDEETKQENMSSGGGSLALVKKRRGLGFFGFSRRRALKRKTEFGRGSYVFPSSVERESECGRKKEEEGEDKSIGYGDGDGITCSQSSRFGEVNISNISRTGSFSTLPTPPSSSSKSHFWTNVYAGLKQVVPWKNKKTTDILASLRLLNSTTTTTSSASLPHRFGDLLTNHHLLMADSSFSVAIRRAASFISSVMRSGGNTTVLEEAAICAVLTNAVEVQDRAGVAIGIAVYGSRFSWINHSCSANACYRFVISPHSQGSEGNGPKVVVRSIKRIKSGEEITVSYIDLLQPTGLRQSDLWSKYRFICNCGRCAASPPAYVDSILEGVVTLDHEITTVGHHDGATVGKMTNHIREAIDDFLSDDINPETCCEKIEGVLLHGILDSSLRLHPSHHVALHAYITLSSAYRIRSIDSKTETDLGRAFDMSRIGAAYSLFLAGVSDHLVSTELSFAISAAKFWTRAGESLLELACKFLMGSSGEYDVKCRKCLILVENHDSHRGIKEKLNQIIKCVTDTSQVTWSFLTRGCPYLQKFKSPIDLSSTGRQCKSEESSVDQRVSILLLSFHCLLYADLLTDLCYGHKSHAVS